MRKLDEKKHCERRRRLRIRSKVCGTAERPRLVFTLSNKHAYAQCINDEIGVTCVALSSLSKDLKNDQLKANCSSATTLGVLFGKKLKEKGIEKIVFDRAGRRYHGCVKAFAVAVREQGIQF